MKRVLALLMLLCLLVPACALAVDLEEVKVTITIPKTGLAPDGEAVKFSVPEGAPYSVALEHPY